MQDDTDISNTPEVTAATEAQPQNPEFSIARNGATIDFYLERKTKGQKVGEIAIVPRKFTEDMLENVLLWLNRENSIAILYKWLRSTAIKILGETQVAAERTFGKTDKAVDAAKDQLQKALTELSVRMEKLSELRDRKDELVNKLVLLSPRYNEPGVAEQVQKLADEIKLINTAIESRKPSDDDEEEESTANNSEASAQAGQAAAKVA